VDQQTPVSAEGSSPRSRLRPAAFGRRRVLVVAGLVLVVVAIVALFIVLSGPSAVSRVGFGVGGTECELAERRSQFTVGEPIRIAADFNPELVTGTEVAFRLLRDGAELDSYRGSLTLAEGTDCIHTTLSGEPLPAGHYRFEVVVASDTVPPLSAEFDISD